MLLPWAATSSCCLVLLPSAVAFCCCLLLHQHFYAVTLLLPMCCYLHAMQAQQLATELVTIVKQLIELNVKARKLKVCPKDRFSYMPILLSCKGQKLPLSMLTSSANI